MNTNELIAGLPGEDLIQRGLADLQSGRRTAPAFLVSMARTRLRRAGLPVQITSPDLESDEPELQLYKLLRREGGDAYSRYNSLLRELISFEQALENRRRHQTNDHPVITGK